VLRQLEHTHIHITKHSFMTLYNHLQNDKMKIIKHQINDFMLINFSTLIISFDTFYHFVNDRNVAWIVIRSICDL
jgi:hypothetical protein